MRIRVVDGILRRVVLVLLFGVRGGVLCNRDLAVDIGRNVYAPHFTSGCFDRIETSNVADYIGLDRVVDDWSPLLSRESCDASLLAYTMNWHAQQNDAPGFERFMPSSKDGEDVQIERTSRAMECIRLHDYLLR